jgi:hypothetical protein
MAESPHVSSYVFVTEPHEITFAEQFLVGCKKNWTGNDFEQGGDILVGSDVVADDDVSTLFDKIFASSDGDFFAEQGEISKIVNEIGKSFKLFFVCRHCSTLCEEPILPNLMEKMNIL